MTIGDEMVSIAIAWQCIVRKRIKMGVTGLQNSYPDVIAALKVLLELA